MHSSWNEKRLKNWKIPRTETEAGNKISSRNRIGIELYNFISPSKTVAKKRNKKYVQYSQNKFNI